LYGLDGGDQLGTEESVTRPQESDFPDDIDRNEDDDEDEEVNTRTFGIDLISYLIGVLLGRWNIQNAVRGPRAFRLPQIFSPLPACSPAMLEGSDGLALTGVSNGSDPNVNGDGIIVDDPEYSGDIIRRLRELFELL
jgi:hypothetical protein